MTVKTIVFDTLKQVYYKDIDDLPFKDPGDPVVILKFDEYPAWIKGVLILIKNRGKFMWVSAKLNNMLHFSVWNNELYETRSEAIGVILKKKSYKNLQLFLIDNLNDLEKLSYFFDEDDD